MMYRRFNLYIYTLTLQVKKPVTSSCSPTWFAYDIGATLFSPMILARTHNNAKVLSSISSAAGLGGITGTLLLSIWGGSRRPDTVARIHHAKEILKLRLENPPSLLELAQIVGVSELP